MKPWLQNKSDIIKHHQNTIRPHKSWGSRSWQSAPTPTAASDRSSQRQKCRIQICKAREEEAKLLQWRSKIAPYPYEFSHSRINFLVYTNNSSIVQMRRWMEPTLLRLPSTSGKDLNGMSWSPACTLPQNQWRQPSVLVSQFLKFLRLSYNSLAPHHQQLHWKNLL